MIIKINIFRGDLSDISAETATLVAEGRRFGPLGCLVIAQNVDACLDSSEKYFQHRVTCMHTSVRVLAKTSIRSS